MRSIVDMQAYILIDNAKILSFVLLIFRGKNLGFSIHFTITLGQKSKDKKNLESTVNWFFFQSMYSLTVTGNYLLNFRALCVQIKL